jgi:predicted phosphodiesterase
VAPSRVDPTLVYEAKRLMDEGMSQTKAARKVGLSQSGLSRALTRLDGPDHLSSDATPDYTEIPVIVRDYSDQDHHYVYPLGDVHIGAPAYDETRWQEWLDYLSDKDDRSMLGTGDFLNSAIKTAVSDIYEERSPVGEAKRLLRTQLKPLRGRIDLLMPGNHEARIWKAVGDCPIRDVADFLDAPYAQHAAMVVYRVGKVEYRFYIRHGTGGGGVGARAARLEKQAQTCDADLFVSGHTHSSLSSPRDVFVYNPATGVGRAEEAHVRLVRVFLRYEGYAAASSFARRESERQGSTSPVRRA